MALVNKKYQFSKKLLLQSTVIQDMLSDCGGELPSEITLPNVISDISDHTVDELEKIMNMKIKIWKKVVPLRGDMLITEDTLQLAIRMDMRYLISKILYLSTSLFAKFIEIPNVLKACIENCNGYAFHVLAIIKILGKRPLIVALYHLQEIVDAEKNTRLILYQRYILGGIQLGFVESKYVLKLIKFQDIENYKIDSDVNPDFKELDIDDAEGEIPTPSFIRRAKPEYELMILPYDICILIRDTFYNGGSRYDEIFHINSFKNAKRIFNCNNPIYVPILATKKHYILE